MKQSLLTSLVASGVISATTFILAGPAQALSFKFTGSPLVRPQLEFTNENVTVTATATSVARQGKTREAAVFRGWGGLGVKNSPRDNTVQIDGSGWKDTLNLEFSQTVKLLTATFWDVQKNDDFSLTVDNQLRIVGDIPNYYGYGFIDFTHRYPDLPSGDLFAFGVTYKNDDYFLKSIHVHPVDVVPTPAAALPALLGMGAAAIRKKRTTAEDVQEA